MTNTLTSSATLAPGHHRHELDGGCCGPRGVATATIAGHLAGALATPDIRDLLPPEPPAHPRGDERRAATSVDLLVLGPIATGNAAQPVVGAMGVKDGFITALGSAEELDGLRGTDTEVVDARDHVIIPGLIEPHMHLWSTAVFHGWVDCSFASNPRLVDVVDRLRDAVARAEPGAWVCGQLLDPSRYPGEPDLTAAILDQLSADVPIVVTNASMHFAYVSSKVFEIAGVTAESPDPPSGKYFRVDGKLTGVVGEINAMMTVLSAMPQKSPAELAAALRSIMTTAAGAGVTSMREAMTGSLQGPAEVAMLHQLNAAERLPTRLSLAQAALLGQQVWADAGIVAGGGDEMIRTDAWKLIADGSNQGRSAFLRTNYLGGMGGTGLANFAMPELTERIREGHEAGWQVMVHANGDAAIDLALTAYEGALAHAAPHDQRHRIEHASIGHHEHFARMARAGISPSFLVNHIYYWGHVLRDNILGPDRAALLHRVHTAVQHGLRPSLHSDYNVSPINPLLAARTAVLRQTEEDGEVLGPDECVTAGVALRAITVDAAWQIHADDRGSLEVGKRADFAIASHDPWTTDPMAWADIKINETRLGGAIAWSG